nr:unnamed protein product [Callosobruchus chinensis]
MQSRKG